ncbi:ovochymase-2 [Corythoichthys intestinalis]|uniref:ovochymase-2 n=1 Tax=Corythoichthys intestinalis TaxID=161448 RepID=UPI0025A54EAB|nr:ovochymase-2 [Corythoichthys intestinalis]
MLDECLTPSVKHYGAILSRQVSLRNKGFHFCGGVILSSRWIMTAAHCFLSFSKGFLSGVTVVVGEYDRRVEDAEEQVISIKSISFHEKYQHDVPMSFDVALVQLDQKIQLGSFVQPICLPLPDESSPIHTSCVVGGWGRIKERGRLPAILREVQLDLVDPAKCKYVLQTVTRALHAANTVVCAGQERGGRDTCQGDSGSPLVCRARSGSGRWEALGITSWGKGCGRSWGNNSSRPPTKRGSPGIFTNVRLLLPWIKYTLRNADDQWRGRKSLGNSGLCSVQDGIIVENKGIIRNPPRYVDHYDNNELCVWTINVPPGSSVLLQFNHFNLENDSYCHYDRLAVLIGSNRPVGIFCGSFLPGPVLLKNTQQVVLVFSSDMNAVGSGFTLSHQVVRKEPDPECGTIVAVKEQNTLSSPNYPLFYTNNCSLRWVIYAPQGHIVKLDFTDFDVEESNGCLYDSLTILGEVQGTEKIAVLCGRSIPPPVLSYHRVMVLDFTSDSSITHRGFKATIAFISYTDLFDDKRRKLGRKGQRTYENLDDTKEAVGMSSSSRVLFQEVKERSFDDEDDSSESSGREK